MSDKCVSTMQMWSSQDSRSDNGNNNCSYPFEPTSVMPLKLISPKWLLHFYYEGTFFWIGLMCDFDIRTDLHAWLHMGRAFVLTLCAVVEPVRQVMCVQWDEQEQSPSSTLQLVLHKRWSWFTVTDERWEAVRHTGYITFIKPSQISIIWIL